MLSNLTTDHRASPPSVVVTTSWDDGHVLDHRLAALLDEYGVEGTFYIAPNDHEIAPALRLGNAGTAEIGSRFEIGGHTLNHRPLITLDAGTATEEITTGKQVLEDILGREIVSFCYPRGEYRATHPAMVRAAGFRLARTVQRWVTTPSPALEMRTTVNAYRHLIDGVPVLRLAGGNPLHAARLFWNWDLLAMAVFDRVLQTGGAFHFWGHSWEIDKFGDWSRLERVLDYIGGRSGVTYVDNAALVPAGSTP
jgi:peptidoglycan/xylan/chitin deacetylase (PgdA/CDA1 family)